MNRMLVCIILAMTSHQSVDDSYNGMRGQLLQGGPQEGTADGVPQLPRQQVHHAQPLSSHVHEAGRRALLTSIVAVHLAPVPVI